MKIKKVYLCKICCKPICYCSVFYSNGLCRSCATKRAFKLGILNTTGKNNYAWRGNKFEWRGYVLVYSPKHPRPSYGSRVFEHRLVMEKKLGRYLESHEIIHHLNGIRNDNRLENLSLTCKEKHDTRSYVKQLQKRVRELEKLNAVKL